MPERGGAASTTNCRIAGSNTIADGGGHYREQRATCCGQSDITGQYGDTSRWRYEPTINRPTEHDDAAERELRTRARRYWSSANASRKGSCKQMIVVSSDISRVKIVRAPPRLAPDRRAGSNESRRTMVHPDAI